MSKEQVLISKIDSLLEQLTEYQQLYCHRKIGPLSTPQM